MSIFNEIDQNDDLTMDDSVDYVEQLVGDGKKFKDVKELAKGKAEADRYIELLKSRLDEAQKEVNTRTSLDSFLKEIKNKDTNPPPVSPPQVVDPKPGLDDSELEKKLEELIARREATRSTQTNLEKVQSVLSEQFGADAKVVINKKAKELGMSLSELESLAAKSPSAFYRLVDVQEQPRGQVGFSAPRSQINSQTQQVHGIKNKAYFDKLKQTDPKKYNNPQTTVEMIKAMKECSAKGIAWE